MEPPIADCRFTGFRRLPSRAACMCLHCLHLRQQPRVCQELRSVAKRLRITWFA